MNFTQLLLGAFAAMLLPVVGQAQRTDESVRVKVHKSQEGHTLQIEEDVPAGDAQDLQQLMNKYGMTDELKELKPGEEVEIVIRRKSSGEEPNDVTIEVDRKPTPKVEEPKPAFLGVHYEMEYGSTNGSHITKVEPNTPAAKAGLKAGDVITQADGIDLYNLEDLADIIGKKKAGEKVKLTYVRDGKVNSTYVTLAERDEDFFRNNPGGGPSYRIEQMYEEMPGSRIWIDDDNVRINENKPASGPLLGVLMIHTEKRININGTETVEKSDGAMVDDVIANSAATDIGIRKGDKIVAVNGKAVNNATEVTNIISAMKAGDRVTVDYMRDGQRLSGSGNLKAREGYDLPSLGTNDVQIMRGEVDPGMFDRMHAMMDEAKARAAGGSPTMVREFRMVIRMDELSPAEAQSLSAKTGQPIKAESDLDLRGLTLSPNPSTGKFQVGFDLPTKGLTQIDVMDMNGKVVYCEKIEDFQGRYNKEFDISQETKGIYVMRIIQNGKSFTRKIVTQ